MKQNRLSMAPIVENQSLKALAYTALKESIFAIDIYDNNVDLRLDERRLSDQLGVSRTPVREAVAQLAQEGLVHVVPRKGIFIVRKTKDEILDMITVWAALESMAARLAAENASDDEIASLLPLVESFDLDDVLQHVGEYSKLNIQFHSAILRLSKSRLLVEKAGDLLRHVRAIRNRSMIDKDRAQRSIEDHRAIVDALRNRDAELASRLVREHTFKLKAHVAAFVEID